jgi:hypothetical protein
MLIDYKATGQVQEPRCSFRERAHAISSAYRALRQHLAVVVEQVRVLADLYRKEGRSVLLGNWH